MIDKFLARVFLIRKVCEVYGWIIGETGKRGDGAQFTMTIPGSNCRGDLLFKTRK
jgi:hypothetical protein